MKGWTSKAIPYAKCVCVNKASASATRTSCSFLSVSFPDLVLEVVAGELCWTPYLGSRGTIWWALRRRHYSSGLHNLYIWWGRGWSKSSESGNWLLPGWLLVIRWRLQIPPLNGVRFSTSKLLFCSLSAPFNAAKQTQDMLWDHIVDHAQIRFQRPCCIVLSKQSVPLMQMIIFTAGTLQRWKVPYSWRERSAV